MKHLDFWFDVISPYAYLAFERLPQALEGHGYSVDYRPVLFAGLLAQWGQKGPAEIAPKREWTFRQVQWIAHEHGLRIEAPKQHPFNPLALLRLVLAAGANRRTVELAMHHVWQGHGADANDPDRVAALAKRLGVTGEQAASPAVKQALRSNTEQAIALRLFGVPTIVCDGKPFFGVDALPMLAAYLRGDTWFDGGGPWDTAADERPGVVR